MRRLLALCAASELGDEVLHPELLHDLWRYWQLSYLTYDCFGVCAARMISRPPEIWLARFPYQATLVWSGKLMVVNFEGAVFC